jgi:hypothetical protein
MSNKPTNNEIKHFVKKENYEFVEKKIVVLDTLNKIISPET